MDSVIRWAVILFVVVQSTTFSIVASHGYTHGEGETRRDASSDSWESLPDVLKEIQPQTNRAFDSKSSGDVTAMGIILDENRILTTKVPGELFFEGDIYLGPEVQRNAIVNVDRLWPGGIVPYEIDPSFDSTSRATILDAINEYHKHTCIRFVARSTQADYIHVYPGSGCWSYVGRSGGKQAVSLGQGCARHKVTPMHEFMHALGFHHEQSRTDRDNYVYILWQNIQDAMESNFEKYGTDYIQDLGASYDYFSIMHYYSKAFTIDGSSTILPKQTGVSESDLGSSQGFTSTDKYKLNALYDCDGGGGGGETGDGSKWREDLRCGSSYPLSDGSPSQCDPNGIYPCCAPSGWCGNTVQHCDCASCTDYSGTGTGGGSTTKWREDLRCGASYPLPNGSPAECDPNGVYPCCAPSGWCGNTVHHCQCSTCTDYTGTGGGGGGGSTTKWREDLRCGAGYPLPNGSPAECDPNGVYPCCAPSGWCGNTIHHCQCSTCTDYGR
ncbi:astacin-like metalloendopeptidase [Glandiceps talaboti]